MERFSGQDAIFLSMERPTWHQHTGGLLIFDPSEAPDFGFETFKQLVAERLPLAPRFVCRVKEVPLGLDLPLWVKDRNFDVSNHMHRVALPSPGGMRELAELAGDLMGHQLDRRMPLWEMWFIEGLEDGYVAVLAKTHHCLMDGASGQGLAEYLFDLEAKPSVAAGRPVDGDDRGPDAQRPRAGRSRTDPHSGHSVHDESLRAAAGKARALAAPVPARREQAGRPRWTLRRRHGREPRPAPPPVVRVGAARRSQGRPPAFRRQDQRRRAGPRHRRRCAGI